MGGYLSHLKPEPLSDILEASCGPIKGNCYRHGSKSIHGYLGIPYAEPPGRFKRAMIAEKWAELRECYQYGPRCPPSGIAVEKGFWSPDEPDERNCLNLNVFVPGWKKSSPRPVMLFLHGGGFEIGASRDFCDYSISSTLPMKDIILITINYRIGVLGFFTTGDEVCRGNFALWDITLALHWVQEHIESFGGDKENVTVCGHSSAGVLTDLLSLSPHSRNLFHKLIPMSGSAHSSFALRTAKNQGQFFSDFLKNHGFKGTSSEDQLEFLKALPVSRIMSKSGLTLELSGFVGCCPNFDGDFLPEPIDVLRGNAPRKSVLTGVTADEGLMFAFKHASYSDYHELLKLKISEDFKVDVISPDDLEDVRQKIYDFYAIPNENGLKMAQRVSDYVGDSLFTTGQLAMVEKMVQFGNDVYFYVFDYFNPEGFGEQAKKMPFLGACHGIELRYLFGSGIFSQFAPNPEELQLMNQFGDFFANFAKNGAPGAPNWLKYDNSSGAHWKFPKCSMESTYFENRCKFMKKMLKRSQKFYGAQFISSPAISQ